MNDLWDVIFQQNKAKEVLTNIYKSRRVPHAFIFSGREGIGKFFTAVQFAKLLNTNPANPQSSEIIHNKIAALQEPYVKLVIPLPRGKNETGEDSATEKLPQSVLESLQDQIHNKSINPYGKISIEGANTIKINSIRDIKKFILLSTESILFRIIIIDDAHLMNDQAQNSLLKNLEEPPEGIIFLLVTDQKEKLLPTIQSRCWVIDFEPLSENSVREILIRHFSIEPALAEKASKFSEGSVQSALSLITQFDLKEIQEHTISFLRFALAKRYNSAYRELSNFISDTSRNSLTILIRMIKSWLDDAVKNKNNLENYYFEDFRETLEKFNNRYYKTNINALMTDLDNLESYYDKNVNLNVLCLSLIFEIASLTIWN